MSVRVDCVHCNSKMVITSSKRESCEYKKLYCNCPKCFASTVFHLSYSHDIHPPIHKKHTLIAEEIRNMEPADQLDLLNNLGFEVRKH